MGYNSTFVVNTVMVTTPEAPVVDPTDPPVNQPDDPADASEEMKPAKV